MSVARPRVYLAGPDVFRPNAKAIGERLKSICAEHGLSGLYPLDNEITSQDGADPYIRAREIYEANIKLIETADAVVADLRPFRGPHMDCGTAYEIGFANAQGLDVFGYTSAPQLASRIWSERSPTGWRDAHGDLVEDFKLVENLMIVFGTAAIFDSAEKAIRHCAHSLAGSDQ